MRGAPEPRSVAALSAGIGAIASLAMAAILIVRRPRPIHSTGLMLTGTVRWRPPGGAPSGVRFVDERGAGAAQTVLARYSRGGGFPAVLPDVVGLAVRFDVDGRDADLLVAGSGARFPWRFTLQPRWTPARVVQTSLMPYRGTNGPVVFAVRPRSPRRLPASMPGLARALAAEPWVLDLAWATPTGPWHRFAELELRPAGGPLDTTAVRFDGIVHPLPGAEVYPWAERAREPSYARSRRSRD